MPTLRTLHALICGLVLATSLSACANSGGDHGAASRQALAAYKEGMRRFDALTPDRSRVYFPDIPSRRAEYAPIEKLFGAAAAEGLPHAHYGLACTIFASGAGERYPEALAHAEQAAQSDVFEGRVLLISYYQWGVGGPMSIAAAEAKRENVLASLTRSEWPLLSGGGTVRIPDRANAEAIGGDILQNGKCAPRTALLLPRWYIEERMERPLPGEMDIDLPIRRYLPKETDGSQSDRNGSYPVRKSR